MKLKSGDVTDIAAFPFHHNDPACLASSIPHHEKARL